MVHHDHQGRVIAHPADDAMFSLPPTPPEYLGLDLHATHKFLVSLSGGKDGAAALVATIRAVQTAGIPLSRVETVFADLGDADEWPGTRELTTAQAARFGLRHHVVYREVSDDAGGIRQQGLLEYIGSRHQQKWPLPNQPYCRSELKRGPIRKLKTRLADEIRRAENVEGPVRIVEVLGIRAQESAPRSQQAAFRPGSDSNSRRRVDVWLPVHHLLEEQVWELIDDADVPWHWIYLFLPRLSCRFCIVAPRAQLVQAARLDPHGARERAELAEKMGHDFKLGLSLRDVIAEAEALGPVPTDRLTSAQLTALGDLQAAGGAK